MSKQVDESQVSTRIADLIDLTLELGATAAAIIDAAEIVVEDDLAELCRPPKCDKYGQAPSCPPHVSGPDGFREMQTAASFALVFKIDVPADALFSNQRREVFQLLHQIAAGVELAAVAMGHESANAFAGGSCKYLFCDEQPDCSVLAGDGPCRYPDQARPSMSGFGIHVAKLMESAGWSFSKAENDEGDTASVCGLVLIG